jgi:hypothetical protein
MSKYFYFEQLKKDSVTVTVDPGAKDGGRAFLNMECINKSSVTVAVTVTV